MEPIELKFAEVHSPLFIAGRNLGLKLDPMFGKTVGCHLEYHREFGEVHIAIDGEKGIIPVTNVICMVPGTPKARIAPVHHAMVANISQTAQVETPFGHVHAGPGKGKTK